MHDDAIIIRGRVAGSRDLDYSGDIILERGIDYGEKRKRKKNSKNWKRRLGKYPNFSKN